MANDPEFDAEYQKELKRLKAEAEVRVQNEDEQLERSRREAVRQKARRKAAEDYERSEKQSSRNKSLLLIIKISAIFLIIVTAGGVPGGLGDTLAIVLLLLSPLPFIFPRCTPPLLMVAGWLLFVTFMEILDNNSYEGVWPTETGRIAASIGLIYFAGNYIIREIKVEIQAHRLKKLNAENQVKLKQSRDQMLNDEGKADLTNEELEGLDSIFISKRTNQ